MTEEQKRIDRGALLLEYEEARLHAAALTERANQMASSFTKLATVLREPERVVIESNIDALTSGIRNPIGINPDEHPATTVRDVLSLCQEIRAARAEVEALRFRKQAIGL